MQLWHPLARDHHGTTRTPTWAGEGEASSAGAGHGDEGGRRAGCCAGCGAGLAVQEVPQVPLVLEPPHHPRQLLVLRQQRLDLVPQLVVAGEDREPRALGAATGHRLHGSPPSTGLCCSRRPVTRAGWQCQGQGHGKTPGSPQDTGSGQGVNGGCRGEPVPRGCHRGMVPSQPPPSYSCRTRPSLAPWCSVPAGTHSTTTRMVRRAPYGREAWGEPRVRVGQRVGRAGGLHPLSGWILATLGVLCMPRPSHAQRRWPVLPCS